MRIVTLSVLCVLGFAFSADVLAPGNDFLVVDKPDVPIENDVISPKSRCSCECNFKSRPESTCTWKVVFKSVAGDGSSVYDTFVDTPAIPGPPATSGPPTTASISLLRRSAPLPPSRPRRTNGNPPNPPPPEEATGYVDIIDERPYRDANILGKWSDLHIKHVEIELFEEGVRRVWFLFNGVGSNLTNWMSKSRLLASPIPGLHKSELNYFSVDGHLDIGHSFEINHNHTECVEECSYMAVIEPSALPDFVNCTHGSTELPAFLYGSRQDGCSMMESGEVREADRLVISVKVCDI